MCFPLNTNAVIMTAKHLTLNHSFLSARKQHQAQLWKPVKGYCYIVGILSESHLQNKGNGRSVKDISSEVSNFTSPSMSSQIWGWLSLFLFYFTLHSDL